MSADTDDPRVGEILRRREERKTAAPKTLKCGACFAPLDEGGICTGCGSDTYATTPTPKRCPTCKGRINAFSGKCPRCDARPVVMTPATEPPQPAPTQPACTQCGRILRLRNGKCYRCIEAAPRPEMCPRGCGKPYHKGLCAGLVTETRADASEAKPIRVERALMPEPAAEATPDPVPIPGPEPEPIVAEQTVVDRPAVEPWQPERATYRYHQPSDDMSPTAHDGNDLVVEITDGGAGPYVVLKTRRWAINPEEIDTLAATLRACLASCTGVREWPTNIRESQTGNGVES